MPLAARAALIAVVLAPVACSSDPELASGDAQAIAADRPLDSAHMAAQSMAARTASLLEAALVQVTAADLRRCLAGFQSKGDAAVGLAPTRPRTWLIVAAAQPVDGPVFALRHEVAPELNPTPGDDWQDRITYRTLLRSPDPAEGSVACLSCVFDYESGAIAYRHAYALDTCHSTVPGERELATVVPIG